MSSLPPNKSAARAATSNQPAKIMSSRLSTMKFMQRASASQPSSQSTPLEPAAKKQRLSNGSHHPAPPSTPRSESQVQTLEREGSERGETKWYLSVKAQPTSRDPPYRVVQAGYSSLDSDGSRRNTAMAETIEHRSGRMSFGKFNKVLEKQQNPDFSSSASDSEEAGSEDDGSEDEDDYDPTGAGAMIRQARREAAEKLRAQRKAERKAEKSDALRMAEERRKKSLKLNGTSTPQSISANSAKNIECHRCGEKGHYKSDCPKEQRPQKQQRMSY